MEKVMNFYRIQIVFFYDGVTLDRGASIDRIWPHGSNEQRTQLQAYPVDLFTLRILAAYSSIHIVYKRVHLE